MSARNRFFILLGIIFAIAATYYFFSTDHSRDLVLIGTVDSNQVIVSAQVQGRIQKLLVDEGTPVKAGDLIAELDPSELQAEKAAAEATIGSLQHKVAETQHTEESTSGSTSSDVANAQAKLSSAKAQLLQAQATLDRTASDSRRTIELAKSGAAGYGEGGRSRSQFRHRSYAPGQRRPEHRGFDRGRSQECDRAEE
jgi:HlyD family secretion protein